MEHTKEKTVLYTVADIQSIFKCGRRQAYELMNMSGFPSFRLNTKLYISQKSLDEWLEKNKNKSIRVS